MTDTAICAGCAKPFERKHKGRVFCSDSCRWKQSNDRDLRLARTQEKVDKAIQQGANSIADVMSLTGLPYNAAATALRRERDRQARNRKFLLQEYWTTAQPSARELQEIK